MVRRVAVCSLAVLGLATGCAGSSSFAEHIEPSRASVLCEDKVDGTTDIDVTTVEVLESIGARPTTRTTDGPFAAFAPNTEVALCLKPIGGGEAEVWAIVMHGQDNEPVHVWTQSPDDYFTWPS